VLVRIVLTLELLFTRSPELMALIRERGAAVSAEVHVEARIGVEAGRSEVVIT
jgi:hypothetical protein